MCGAIGDVRYGQGQIRHHRRGAVIIRGSYKLCSGVSSMQPSSVCRPSAIIPGWTEARRAAALSHCGSFFVHCPQLKTPRLTIVPVQRAGCFCILSGTYLASTTSGFPFSTIYVASSAAVPLPTFFAEWFVPAGINKTPPALSVTGGLPSTSYSNVPSRT